MTNKPNLILDLDETLVKSFVYFITDSSTKISTCDYNDELLLLSYDFGNSKTIIYKRPFLFDFLLEMNQHFNISVYSLGHKYYVNMIVNKINEIIGYNIFKNVHSNNPHKMIYYKNLKSLKIEMFDDNCMIIDDRIDVWWYDSYKVYHIKQYDIPSDDDIELLRLIIKIKKYIESHEKIDCNELLLSLLQFTL